MAEVTEQHLFTHKEIAEALIKQQGLHEGIWGIYVEFGIAAGNVAHPSGVVLPTAIVPLTKLGIQRMKADNPLAVDAAEVNPPKKG